MRRAAGSCSHSRPKHQQPARHLNVTIYWIYIYIYIYICNR